LRLRPTGRGCPAWERKPEEIFLAAPLAGAGESRAEFFRGTVEPIFQRELNQRGIVTSGTSYQAELILFSDNSSGTFRPTEAK